jgi:paraquat-inducible protein B
MSKKVNPTVIGLFILVGLGLGVSAVFLFGSSRLFTRTKDYVLYFDASLQGLDAGTPVKFRGVTIGRVKDVLLHFNQAPGDTTLPVIIELNENLLNKKSDETFNLTEEAQFDAYVKRGLRGRLEVQSLLTGLLYVDLDFLPAMPAIYHQSKPIYREIPTAHTEIQKLLDNVFRIDLAGMADKLSIILSKFEASLGEIQMKEINRGLTNLLVSLNAVVTSPGLTNTLASAHQALDEFRLLSEKLRHRVDGLADSADETLAGSRETLAELRGAAQDVRDWIAPQAPLRRDLDAALGQMGGAARSVEGLVEFLKRHPNAVLSGKKTLESK